MNTEGMTTLEHYRSRLYQIVPIVTCLCGSTKYPEQFRDATKALTLNGKIVLAPGFFGHVEGEPLAPQVKEELDELHLHKIERADEIFVVNVGGYVGASTRREIWYAAKIKRRILWLEPDKAIDVPGWTFEEWLAAGVEASGA